MTSHIALTNMRLVTQNMLFCNVKVRFNFVGNSVVPGSFSAMQDCVATAHLDGQKPKNFPLQVSEHSLKLLSYANHVAPEDRSRSTRAA